MAAYDLSNRRWLAHVPLANTIAMISLKNIEMDVAIVMAVGARPQHCGKAMTGGIPQLLKQRLRNGRVGQLYMTAISEDEGAHVDRIALTVLAEFRVRHTVATAALV